MNATASSPAAERIRKALDLESVSLTSIPEDTVEKLAEISEAKLRRFPRKLRSITDDKRTWGGTYYPKYRFNVSAKMTHDETVQVFVHEFGHAVHYAICDISPRVAENYRKTVTSIRDDNIKRLTGIYWKAAQHAPALNDLFMQYKYASCVSVRDMYDRLKKDKKLIPERFYREFEHNLFSRYSLKNFNEYFCENFSAWITLEIPSEFALAVGMLAEKYATPSQTSIGLRTSVYQPL